VDSEIVDETADVAAFAMMIASKHWDGLNG
jgi:hypothetical protein